MKKKVFAAIMAALSLWACGGPESFKVEVDAPSVGTQEITVVYTLPDGNRAVVAVPALNGRFEFEGSSTEPSVIEMFTANKRLLGALIASNGDRLKVSRTDSAWTVEDNVAAQMVLNYRPGTPVDGLPPEVAEAVKAVYGDRRPAGSWPEFVSPELLIAKDSVNTFAPEGVWFFTSSAEERTLAVRDSMRRYARLKRPVRDVFLSADTAYWRIITRNDSATWTQALLPDAPLRLEGTLSTVPCLVEVDTAGTVKRVQRLP